MRLLQASSVTCGSQGRNVRRWPGSVVAALALSGLLASFYPAIAQAQVEDGSQELAAGSSSTWEELERRLPEPAKKAFQSCAMDDLTAALIELDKLPHNDEVKALLSRVREELDIVSEALAKAKELGTKGDFQSAIDSLEPAFKTLPDLVAYGGCKKHADEVMQAMANLSAPFQVRHQLNQAVNNCDLAAMRSFARQVSGEGRADELAGGESGLKDTLSAIGAFDAADEALRLGDADKAEAALASGQSALEKSPIAKCRDVRADLEDTRTAIVVLRNFDGKLHRAAADCDKHSLKGISDELSASRGLWVPAFLDGLNTAYRTCSEQTASWRKELEKDF